MRRILAVAALAAVAACGRSEEDALQDAANQSDPAAAQVLNQAAEQGVDPQQALEAAGQAAAATGDEAKPNSTLQARPNLPKSPNRPAAGEAPQKVDVQVNAATENHAEHNGH